MNRREILLGVAATAVAAAVTVVEATATWRELHDGTPFVLGAGDFQIEMWLRRPDETSKIVSDLTIRGDVPPEGMGMGTWDVVRAVVERYENRVPADGVWHHLYAHGGAVFVDGELVDKPDVVALTHHFGEASMMFDGTGDYVAVP